MLLSISRNRGWEVDRANIVELRSRGYCHERKYGDQRDLFQLLHGLSPFLDKGRRDLKFKQLVT